MYNVDLNKTLEQEDFATEARTSDSNEVSEETTSSTEKSDVKNDVPSTLDLAEESVDGQLPTSNVDVESQSTTQKDDIVKPLVEKDISEDTKKVEDEDVELGACAAAPEITAEDEEDVDFQELIALRASMCQSGMSEFDLNEVKSQVI